LEGAFDLAIRTIVYNPVCSGKVAQRFEERNSIEEIVPNPFGGVNTHLWSNEAYIVGIVPDVLSSYSPQTRNGKETGGKEFPCLSLCLETDQAAASLENSRP
jgi:hypothetical protein